jgi:hypothetical protein
LRISSGVKGDTYFSSADWLSVLDSGPLAVSLTACGVFGELLLCAKM